LRDHRPAPPPLLVFRALALQLEDLFGFSEGAVE
jgi:hypothetical protein